jgi:hypothetical protein
MTNYSMLSESELIEALASNTDKYMDSMQIDSDCSKQFQLKEIIDDVVNEFSRRRFDSPIYYCHY